MFTRAVVECTWYRALPHPVLLLMGYLADPSPTLEALGLAFRSKWRLIFTSTVMDRRLVAARPSRRTGPYSCREKSSSVKLCRADV